MTVYVCLGCDYDGDWTRAVFSTREAAEAFLVSEVDTPLELAATRIEAYVVDALPDAETA